MTYYKQKYLKYFGYGEQEWIPCEICNNTAIEVHHILAKSQGGKDEISNLMALCRNCHDHAHSDKVIYERSYFQKIHNDFIMKFEK